MKEEGTSSVNVEIMGLRLKVGSKHDSEYIKKVASYVEREMHSVKGALGAASSLDIAIIAAMNIADRHIRDTNEQKKGLTSLLDKSERLINFIGERLR